MIFLRFDEAHNYLSSNMGIIYEDEAPTLISLIGRDIYYTLYTINEAPTLDTKAMIFLGFDPFEYCKVSNVEVSLSLSFSPAPSGLFVAPAAAGWWCSHPKHLSI